MKEESTSNVFVHERNASDSDAFVEPGDDEWQKDDYLPLETNNDIRKKDLDDRDKEENSDMDQSDVDATIPPEADEPWNLRMSPPWIQEDGRVDRRDQSTHPITALHNEIVSFVHLLEPLPSEIEQREELICRIRDTVQRFFPDGTRVVVFGSQATGLFLPTSDIDLVIMSPSEDKKAESKQSQTLNRDDENDVVNYTLAPQSPLHCFAQSIRQDWGIDEFSYMELVENTRIPLVKFTHAATRINVDVSFDQPSGPPAAHLMKRYLEALPPLRPLTFVLKYFLAARCLNEPYTGGVGSFLLQLMIVSFLQHRERDAVNYQRPSVYNLGTLLLEFLELYGLDFNYYTTGISVRYDGFYFPKGAADRRTTFWKLDRMSMMAMENPLEPTQDVGQSSFRYQTIQRAFAVAYKTLLAYLTAGPDDTELLGVHSTLATILPPTHYMTSRKQLKRQYRPLISKRKDSNSSIADSKRIRLR